MTYSVIADIGTYGRTFKLNSAKANRGDLADSGANCSMTANRSLLENVKQLTHPFIIGLAVSSNGSISSSSECTHIGDLSIKCDDSSSFATKCFYNPNASDTIISPQAIIDESTTNSLVGASRAGNLDNQANSTLLDQMALRP
jgi:hypothetical protein